MIPYKTTKRIFCGIGLLIAMIGARTDNEILAVILIIVGYVIFGFNIKGAVK